MMSANCLNILDSALVENLGPSMTMYAPHMVNYRANVWAMKDAGVEERLGTNAVGSLKEHMKPGDVVVPDQYVDYTKNRKLTFHHVPRLPRPCP